MEIVHKIGANSIGHEEYFNALLKLDLHFDIIDSPLGSNAKILFLNVYESNPLWGEVAGLRKKYRDIDIYDPGDIYETFFSDEEIRNAEWCRLLSTFERGNPQPSPRWPRKQQSLTLACNKCAIYEQIDVLRMKKEPKLGKNSFMTLMALAEYFASPEVFMSLAEIRAKGYQAWDVVVHKTGDTIRNVEQLYVPGVAKPGLLEWEGMTENICPQCGRSKFYVHQYGKMRIKRDSIVQNVDFMKTNEWFGSGLIAFQDVLVSNRIANLILDKKWQGVRLKAVELVD